MKLLQRLENIMSPVKDCGQGLTAGKCPRQSLIELAADWRILAGIENIMLSNKVSIVI